LKHLVPCTMANNLARIFGTEEDKVNCSFYFKIGACRHGERCSRLHMKPNFSQTLLLAHFYMPPPPKPDGKVVDDSEHYEIFYEDVMDEMTKFGDVEELVICENLGDHMFGNTYVKFATEEQAHKALINLRGRYFCGRIVQAEYSPVTDFREGRCRQFDEHNCLRGGYCNFLHLKAVPRFARKYLRKTRLRNRYRHPYGLEYHKKMRDDDWPRFPIRGTSEERRHCISKWNKLWKKQQEKEKLRKLKALKKKKQHKKERKERERRAIEQGKGDGDRDRKETKEEVKKEAQGSSASSSALMSVDVKAENVKTEAEAAASAAPAMPFMNPERLAMLSGR